MWRIHIEMHSGAYASSHQDTDYTGAGDRQKLRPPVDYQWCGRPELGVRTSRFEPLSDVLGPPGRRGLVRRLQRRLGRL
jgi:hypothetical protein